MCKIKIQKPRCYLFRIYFSLLYCSIVLGCTGISTVEVSLPESFAITSVNPPAPLQAEIRWQSAKGATNYKVVYGTSSGNYTNVVSENATSPVVVSGLSDGVTYYFKVTALNLAGAKEASNEMSITVYGDMSFSSVSPAEGFFAGGQTVTLTGTGFQPGSSVQIGGVQCTSVAVVSSSTITCKTPSRITSGATNISISNTLGKTVTLVNGYNYKSDAFQKLEFLGGQKSNLGYKNAVGKAAKFFRPSKPLIYNGFAYITDTNNHMIRRMNLSTLQVEDVAGFVFLSGNTDGVGSAARFYYPMGMVRVGTDIYIADSGNCLIRKLNTINFAVTTFAGQGGACTAAEDPNGAAAGFSIIHSLTTDGSNLYVGDDSGVISRVSLTPPYATTWLNSSTLSVNDIVYLNGYLYYTEWNLNYSFSKISLSTEVTTNIVSGSGLAFGGIETDGTDLYISMTDDNTINRISAATNAVTTIIGDGSAGPEADGLGVSAKIDSPSGLFYSAGELYFTSYAKGTIRKYNFTTTAVTTLSGGGQ